MKPAARSSEVVEIYDTTLRDGTQREGISLSSADKVRIAERLDALGVAYVEAGFPGSNPKDAEVFRRLRDVPFRTTAIAAFGSTRRADLVVEDDPNLAALIAAGTPVCTIFGKSSTMHVEQVLRIGKDENLKLIEESVAYLKAAGRRVFYDAEHFFDGWVLDGAYALESLQAAARGGAEAIVLCDTNGGMLPWMIEDAMGAVRVALRAFEVTLGIHAHDDSGCAVANSLTAVRSGARQVQGTINGYGERCGNANLVTLIAGLELKLGMRALPASGLVALSEVSRFVAEVANLAHDDHAPYVGKSAFAHKGGVHVAAIQRASTSYEHVAPALVGNQSRVVVSELSGRANVRSKVEELGLDGEGERDVSAVVVRDIKEREASGASYEAAEASIALMVKRRRDGYVPPFRVLDWRVISTHSASHQAANKSEGSAASMSEATVKLDVAGRIVHTAAEGCGPVAALDAALRKALTSEYPDVERMKLVDYKVRILDGREGTAATTRVLVDTGIPGVESGLSERDARWSTVGAAASIIDASLEAVADGIEYGLTCLSRRRSAPGPDTELSQRVQTMKTKEVA